VSGVAADSGDTLLASFLQPGTIWCYGHHPEAGGTVSNAPPPDDLPFRWVHLNLGDQRSQHWLEAHAGLPAPLLMLLRQHAATPGVLAVPGGLGLAVNDFEHGLPPTGAGQIGTLYIAATERMLVTGRVRPLHSADLVHDRLTHGGEVGDPAAALTFLLGTMIDSFASLVLDLNTQLLEIEAEVMADAEAPDSRELVAARHRSAQLHRLAGSLRATLHRMEAEPSLASAWRTVAPSLLPRLAMLEADITSAQQQLRLLRDDLDLQTAQRTNRNVYILSVLTAVMMPATLITGFFGMNTGGLPFVQEGHGTVIATLIGLFSAAGTYGLLYRMGFFRRQ